MSARETGDLPRCALCGSLNGIIDRQVMLLSITRGPGHRELWSVMACERCAVAVVEKNTGDGAQVHAPLAASTPTTAPPPASPEPAREWTDADEADAKAFRELGEQAHSDLCAIGVMAIGAMGDDAPSGGREHEALMGRFLYTVRRVAPHFAPKVRVKLPAPGAFPNTSSWAEGRNRAIAEIAFTLRSAGIEIEGEAP